MTYKDHISASMECLGAHPRTIFVGYNVLFGKAAGTLNRIKEAQLIEMPLAEGVMASAAIGMSLDGCLPVLYFERMDFLTNAMDAIVNHLDKMSGLSEGLHKPSVIIRCVVGNKNFPLFTGSTHTQEFSIGIREMVGFKVCRLINKEKIQYEYASALRDAIAGKSSMMVEYKDYWDL